MSKQLLEEIQNADVILILGSRLSQVSTQDYSLISRSTKLIQIDISENSIGKAYPVSTGVVSDVKRFLKKSLQFLNSDSPKSKPKSKQEREIGRASCRE